MSNDLSTGVLSLTSTLVGEINNFLYKNQTITKIVNKTINNTLTGVTIAVDIVLNYTQDGLLKATVFATSETYTAKGLFDTTVKVANLAGNFSLTGITKKAIIGIISGYLANKTIDSIFSQYDYSENNLELYYDQKTKTYICKIPDSSVSSNDIKKISRSIIDTSASMGISTNNYVIEETIGNQTYTYSIVKGDTVWQICQDYGLTYDELIEYNPWLEDRFSEDRSFALIRPGETLNIPDINKFKMRKFYNNFDNDDNEDSTGGNGSNGGNGSTGNGEGNGGNNGEGNGEGSTQGSGESNGGEPEDGDGRSPDYFNEANETEEEETDPILIDLDGDGIKTTTILNGINFDHENDGFAELSAWVDENDGVLFIDKNNNGKLDNGTEVFGENYTKSNNTLATDAFDALADLDSNNDGVIDSNDTNFANIKIQKGDGTILSLNDANIISINLTTTTVNQEDENGNTLLKSATFTKSDNTTGVLSNYNLNTDKFHSRETELLPETNDIAELPDINGTGIVHSLHQAMLRDLSGDLQTLVETFISDNTTEATRMTTLDQIMLKWAGVENVQINSRGENVNAQHLAVLEKFMGRPFYSTYEEQQNNEHPENPNLRAGRLLETAYVVLKSEIYGKLSRYTLISDLLTLVKIDFNGNYILDDVITELQDEITEDETSGKLRVLQFAKVLKGLGLDKYSNFFDPFDDNCFYTTFTANDRELKWEIDSFGKVLMTQPYWDENNNEMGTAGDDAYRIYSSENGNYMRSLSGADVIYGGAGDDVIETCTGGNLLDGGAGNDYLRGQDDSDTIFGGAGNDTIRGEAGDDILFGDSGDDTIIGDDNFKYTTDNDIIRGGQGNDTIISFFGDDTYIFDRGDGQDTIYESEGIDKLHFGNNITWSDLQFTRENNDMVITLLDNNVATTDTITIAGWFEDFQGDNTLRYNNQRIEVFEFKDGSTHYANEIAVNDNKFSIIYNMSENNNITTAANYFSTVNLTSGDNTVTMGENSINVINFDNWGINAVINNSSANDKIVFGQGITLSNTIFDNYEDRLEVTFTNHDGKITINDYKNLQFEYADETLVTNITPYLHSTYTYEDLTMNANLVNVEILGDDDVEITTNSNDNYIKGNTGDNSYIFIGGQDVIEELGGDDKIVFGQGITANDIYFVKDFTNDCLYIKFNNNNTDQITILNYFTNPNNKIETLELYDETTITNIDNSIRTYIIAENVTLPSGVSEAELVGEGFVYAVGNSLNNNISGNIGDNAITGGQGNDNLTDTYKTNETYYYNLGDGNDTIEDVGGVDAVIFGENISASNITMAQSVNDLVITIGNNQGQITIQNYFSNAENRVELFKFYDGTVIDNITPYIDGIEQGMTIADYQQGSVVMNSTSATMTGTGNAYVLGSSGNDTITGNNGNNTYAGGQGDDTITDTLGGNDVYFYNINNGNDVITDLGGTDTIRFGQNISSSDLIFKQNEYNLEITFANRQGSLVINNYFLNDNYKLENLVFDDNTTISNVSGLLSQITVFNDYQLSENSGIEVIKLTTSGGNISVEGNSDNNTIIGNSGNNTYQANEGNDTITDILGGNDTYIYNLGDGLDTITDIGGIDTVSFGEGITTNNLTFVKADDDLEIWVSDNQGLIIKNYFVQDNEQNYINKIERFEFADETVITDISNYITAIASVNSITLGSGYTDAYLRGDNNASVTGNSADNTIYGNDGDNTIQGGLGDDTIYNPSTSSNDTYVYNLGDGFDVIEDRGGHNRLVLGAGINFDNLDEFRQDNDLILNIKSADGSQVIGGIKVKNAYVEGYSTIRAMYFTDYNEEYGYNPQYLSTFASESSIDNSNGDFYELRLFGTENTSVTGCNNNEIMIGNSGNNTYQGNGGDDIIEDTAGNDTYIYNLGDGHDSINDQGGYDTIRFGQGISLNNIKFKQQFNDLEIEITNQNQSSGITINDYFNQNSTNTIERIEFFDNSYITDITPYISVITVDRNYTIAENSSITDVYMSGNENLSVVGNSQNNYIQGNTGNNTYQGNGGNDSLIDFDGGNDTYIYNLGDGHDFINDQGGYDTIRFGQGISLNNIKFKQQHNNLEIEILNQNQSNGITINDYFNQNLTNTIEKIEFFDNSYITDITPYLSGITVDSNYTISENSSITDVYMSGNGNLSVVGNSQNNYFEDNSGNNTFEGKGGDDGFSCYAGGNDTYIFNVGDGWDWINDNGGSDTIHFGQTVTLNNTEFRKDGNNLQIVVNDGTTWSGIYIIDQFDSNQTKAIERFEFYDGTYITDLTNYVTGLVISSNYTMPENTIYSKIYMSGNSNLSVVGNSQDNYFEDNSGNNTFEGKGGDDGFNCYSGGNDTYIFNVGDGWDWINDNGGSDTIQFGQSVTLNNTEFIRNGNSLQVMVNDGTTWSGIYIVDHFDSNQTKAIERFEFYDGTYITDLTSYINNIQQQMSSFGGGGEFLTGGLDNPENTELILTLVS